MFARVRERLQMHIGPREARVAVSVVAAAVLLSAIWNAYLAIENMDRARDQYTELTTAEREQEVERSLGFDLATWNAIRRAVGEDDRFAVVSDAPEQHEVRNYAAYVLLPAIQVPDPEEATVVLYWATPPPAGAACEPLAANVCLERRGRA
jgi:hypothetical protein